MRMRRVDVMKSAKQRMWLAIVLAAIGIFAARPAAAQTTTLAPQERL